MEWNGLIRWQKAKEWISERVLQENKARQIFQKTMNPWYACIHVRARE